MRMACQSESAYLGQKKDDTMKYFGALISMLLAGCGYTFQGGGSVLPPDVTRIAIPLVENNSPEPGLAEVVTEALRDRFERFGVLTVVDGIDEADAVLYGKIDDVLRDTRTTTSSTDTDLQLDTILVMSAELRRVSGPLLWRASELRASRAFGTSSDVVVTSSPAFAGGLIGANTLLQLDTREVSRGQEQDALVELADQMARKIYEQAVAPDF
jgi:hypothetical protein